MVHPCIVLVNQEAITEMKRDITIVHPELQQLARKFPPFTFSFSGRNLWLWRLLDKILWKRIPPRDISIKNTYISRQEDRSQIRLRIYRPKTMKSTTPALFWLHGGGYILGKPEQDDRCCIQYVREMGIVVVSVDYRYAPEHPFPCALEDSYAAMKWVYSNALQLGIDPGRIAMGGESAGGGLAAALVQLTCDRNEVKPIFQLLAYPMLDDRSSIRTDMVDHGFLTWNQDSNRFGWESYLGRKCGSTDVPEYSVPARHADLSGLPPTWLGVGTLDLFYDEDVAYAQRLEDCGVPCELCVVEGAFHGFDMWVPDLKVAQDFRKSQIETLKKYMFL